MTASRPSLPTCSGFSAPLGQRRDDGLVDAGPEGLLGHAHVAMPRDVLAQRGIALDRVAHEPERPHRVRRAHVLARIAGGDHLLARVPARAHVCRYCACLGRRRRDQVVGVRVLDVGQRRVVADGAVVDQAQAVDARLAHRSLGLERVDEPPEEVRYLAVDVPRRVVLEPARVALEQQLRRAELGNLLEDRSFVRHQVAGEPLQLAVDHQPGPRLEDVGARPDDAGVLEHLRAAPARVKDDLGLSARARLQRPHPDGRERPLAVAQQRRAASEQRAVEIDVQAAQQALRARRPGAQLGHRWALDEGDVAVHHRPLLELEQLPAVYRDLALLALESRLGSREHAVGHRPELGQRLVAVLADVEVDLGHRVQADRLVDVDQQRGLDRVPAGERDALEQVATAGHLARQRLLEAREVGPVHVQQGARHQLGDAAPALGHGDTLGLERAAVEALDEVDARHAYERAELPAHEVLAELLGVGVDEGDQPGADDRQRPPHGVALAQRGAELGQQRRLLLHLGARLGGHLGGAVERAGIDDEDRVDHVLALEPHQAFDDRADRLGALARGHAHGHRVRAEVRDPLRRKVPMVVGPALVPLLCRSHTRLLWQGVGVSPVMEPWGELLEAGRAEERLVHETRRRPQSAATEPLPADLHPAVAEALLATGVDALYAHQAEAWERAADGPVIVTTGTASGKSLCFNLPTLDVLHRDRHARALYLYPTKALAQDQARALHALGLPGIRPAIYDGDTPRGERAGIRRRANVVLTNPDMLHLGILPNHPAWGDVLANLAVVVVDEAHVYRGVFGSHVANVLRRLRRLAAVYGTAPRFLLASATVANPLELAEALSARDAAATLREDGEPELAERVAPYRAGYTPAQRRELERRLVDGELLGVVATDALELGIDIGALDAAISVTFPGTVASLRQMWGRAGRRGRGFAVYIAGEDALDQFFCRHPDEFWDRPVEAAILDHANEQIYASHLLCAAHEGPLEAADG